MRTVDTTRIPPAGDPFSAKTPKPAPKPKEKRLRELEDRYRHELMDDEDRQHLRDRVLRLRRRLARGERRPPRAPGT
jgi:hypothetical protein